MSLIGVLLASRGVEILDGPPRHVLLPSQPLHLFLQWLETQEMPAAIRAARQALIEYRRELLKKTSAHQDFVEMF